MSAKSICAEFGGSGFQACGLCYGAMISSAPGKATCPIREKSK